MARDFDFRRTPISRPITTNPSVVKPAVLAPQQKKVAKKSKNVSWIAVVVILAVFALGVGMYYQSLQPPKVTNTNNNANKEEQQTEKKELVIDVFDGGAGADVLASTVGLLKEGGFSVKDAGKTQFEYDKTYIWYVTGFESDAQKIAAILSSRKTVLKESKVSGAFTIQVQLGKE